MRKSLRGKPWLWKTLLDYPTMSSKSGWRHVFNHAYELHKPSLIGKLSTLLLVFMSARGIPVAILN